MKKLLGILALVLMFCSNVYAASISDLLASISDLLGSKKSVILKCITDKGYSITSEGIVDRPGWIGSVNIWEIRDGKYFYWNNEQSSFGKNEEFVKLGYKLGYKILNKLTITEDKYHWKSSLRNKDGDKLYESYDIEISRNSGRFTFNATYNYTVHDTAEGTCEKITNKKL